MQINKCTHFDFWRPVEFTENPGSTVTSRLLWNLGSWADRCAYLGPQNLLVKATQIDGYYSFAEEPNKQNTLLHTAAKVGSYLATAFILPTVALLTKVIFKIYLNHLVNQQAPSPNELIAEKKFGRTKIVLLEGSLTEENTKAIVNAANAHLAAGSGVCGAIKKAAGQEVFDECKQILKTQNKRSLLCGQAALTTAGKLSPQIQTIVHAVGPDCRVRAEKANRVQLLTDTYTNSLELITAPEKHAEAVSEKSDHPTAMRTIAFPSISTGIYGYSLKEAPEVALKAIKTFIEKHPKALDEVRFVFLPSNNDPDKTSEAYQKAFAQL